MSVIYDLAVIGGGINGCGIARDAAGRGLSVYLCEQGDLAQGTSSASTKLIHGGLRYLEYYEFRLVREALIERETLLRAAPHIIWPLRFILPHHKALRPAWLIRLGLFIYDHLGGRKLLPATRVIDLARDAAGKPLKPLFTKAFEYSDCWVEDSRMVVLNAIDAAERGARIETRARCDGAVRDGDIWTLRIADPETGAHRNIRARALVNAAGPWVARVIDGCIHAGVDRQVRLVRGSHIVVRRLFDHDRAYIFQNADGRIVFAIPYERDFTLIGTTDRDFEGDPGKAAIGEDEIVYLCAAASEYFADPVKREDVVWSYSGVRPLYDDGAKSAQAATRDYVLKVETVDGAAPVLNIFGGKITTYRKLAEAALKNLARYLPSSGAAWTAAAPLPGGDFTVDAVDAKIDSLRNDYPFLDARWARRLIRAYGTRAWRVLGDASNADDLGEDFGATLTEREARYLVEAEWAMTADDILWRRSKLGLHMTKKQTQHFTEWMKANRPAAETAA